MKDETCIDQNEWYQHQEKVSRQRAPQWYRFVKIFQTKKFGKRIKSLAMHINQTVRDQLTMIESLEALCLSSSYVHSMQRDLRKPHLTRLVLVNPFLDL